MHLNDCGVLLFPTLITFITEECHSYDNASRPNDLQGEQNAVLSFWDLSFRLKKKTLLLVTKVKVNKKLN